MKNDIFAEINKIGLLPQFDLKENLDPVSLAEALSRASLPCAEIGFSPDAEPHIKAITSKLPDFIIGVRGVKDVEALKRAVSAGAKFFTGFDGEGELGRYCLENDIPFIPSCSTAGEIEAALQEGLTTVKFFPAEQAGGLSALKTLGEAYPEVKFLLGGVSEEDFVKYADYEKVIGFCAPWLMPAKAVKEGDFAQMEALARANVSKMLGFFLKHVGINSADEKESNATADAFEKLFGFKKQDFGGAYFNDTFVEVMKKPFYGRHGHIAIGVNNMERALYRFRKAGVAFIEESAGYNPDGSLRVIYFKEEIGGFAVHIVQK
ncbi:bifunctional 4-hydroxy-2-oxoglutarate aldolase/2-dehydro-3-deoxy-phosphogluconate aldolase [Candidatus Proelusimicrobium volucris]|uniref:bifunctional 4-hydroxy-2-oxoglutarate aldolase/2-dehydro-3-deoxy-phosphogluconate aldolase n=1 Tax=Candidatus Proelusimicrobium volucris TaxID=3416225 RepID=UPI003D1012C7